MMKLKVNLTNEAVLRSGEDLEFNTYEIIFRVSDLPLDVRSMLADRLYLQTWACLGILDAEGNVTPYFDDAGAPALLALAGTEIKDLIHALRADDDFMSACREKMADEEA